MKVLLIFPPQSAKLVHGSLEQFKKVDVGAYPPLGLMCIAAYLKKYSVYDVQIVDAVGAKMNYEQLSTDIRECAPEVVGIYTSTFTIYDSHKTAKLVKQIDKKIKVIFGGPHIEIYPEETLNLPEVDFVVLGEGEISLLGLLDSLAGRKELSEVKGIGYKKNGELYFTEKRPLIPNLDEIPFPAREMTNYRKYYSLIGRNEIATTIMSSRGCPHRCSFCYVPYMGTLRLRSAKNVISEIEECIGLGIREFFFFDENFTVNKKIVTGICDEIISKKLNIVFYIRSRIDTVNEEMLRKLKRAGCERIQFGVESGSPRILKAMNKKITREQIEKTFHLTRKIGIPIYADFMFGYPGETEEEMEETIQFANKLDPDFVQYGVTMFLPQTKIYEDALRSGLLKEDFWRNLARNPTVDVFYPLGSNLYSRRELEEIQRKAYLSFYFRPKYLMKRLIGLRSFLELKRQLPAGFRLLRGRSA